MSNVSLSNSEEVRVPKLRFPGFEGEYRAVTLGEIANKVVRNDPSSDAPVMMISAKSGFINQSEKYSRENAGQSLKKYTLLKKGELAYNHGASKLRQYGCCLELKEDTARIPYVYHTFSIKESEFAPYIALLLNNPIMDRQLKKLVSSSVRMDGLLNISYDEYMSIKLSVPILKTEQEKLYSFFEKLDQYIEKQCQLVELLKLYKRGLLSKLFPQNDETAPQYRFTGFTESWKKQKLGEILITVPIQPFVKSPVQDGKYEIIQQGNEPIIGYANGNPCIDYKNIVVFGDHTLSLYKPFNPFFVATDGIRILKGKDSMDGFYLYALLETFKPQSKGYKRYYSILANSNCYTTDNPNEQKLIGQCCQCVDCLIANNQHKLEKIQFLKSGLLQQLFI